MKTQLHKAVFFLLFLFAAKLSFSQVNSYLVHNPVWQVYSTCTIGGPCVSYETYNYYTNGDTLIDSVEYIQIYKKGQGYLVWNAGGSNMGCTGTFMHIDTFPSYFIRSLDKQMYVRLPGDTLEKLLYDFNLEVGDTLPFSFNNYFQEITVSAVDSIFTPYGYRQRFTLAGSTWAQYLIEGIGHSRGLVEPLKVPANCTYSLNCFSLNDTSYFPTPGGTCTIAIGINDQNSKTALSVFPNPFSASTTFEFDAALKNVELKIYNMYGQQVEAIQTVTNGKIILNRGDLDAGIYFYELKAEGNSKTIDKLLIEE